MRLFPAVVLALLCCVAEAASSDTDSVPLLGYDLLAPMLRPVADTLLVVNFWATWCQPCVEELPAFLEAADSAHGRPVRFLLVSMDLERAHEALPDFLRSHRITLPVVHLIEARPDRWIPQIDSTWTGSLPATMFVRGSKKTFEEHPWQASELWRAILKQLSTSP
jgi:thiol-disulfide isomerase/thioredoxin